MRLSLGVSLGGQQRPRLGEIIEALPENLSLPVISGDPATGVTLSSTSGAWSGGNLTVSRQWQRNEENIGGQTDVTYIVHEDDYGQEIRLNVTAQNSEGSATASSNPIQILFAVPNFTVNPVITGTPERDETLYCSNGIATGNVSSYSYQWYVNNSPVAGAIAATYIIPGDAEDDDEIHCEVTAANMAGTDAALSNTVSVEVVEGGAPVISGTAHPGNTLTSTQSGQWYLNGSPISGETGGTLALAYTAIEPDDEISQQDSNVLTVQSYDTDAATDIAAVISSGSDWGTTDAERRNNKWRYSELVTAWKSAGVYSTSYFYRVLAGPTSLDGVFACGRNGSITNTNFVSGDLNRLTGLKGSTNKYLNTGVPTNTYPTDDCLVGIYLTETLTTGPVGGAAIFGDAGSGVAGSIQLYKDSTDRSNIRFRSSGALINTVAVPSTWARFTSLGRNNASTCEFHTNGLSETEALTSSGSLTTHMYFYSRASSLPSDPRAALLWFSNFEDEAAIDGPMQTYLTNLI